MRRTQIYQIRPWVGGVNTSVDSGVLNPQELVVADNVVFSSTGARIKREALQYLDTEVPVPTHRSSSGTTRTLRFATNELVTNDTENLVVGERINVSGLANYNATDVPVLTVNDLGSGIYSITYTGGSSLTEGNTATSAITITRASSVIAHKDYWRWTGSQNESLQVYATDNFQLFQVDDNGNRVQIHGQEQATEVTCGAGSTLTDGDYFTMASANDATLYYVWYNVDAGGSDPAPAGRTGIEVEVSSGDTATEVAEATAEAIDLETDFSADNDTNVVLVTNALAGITSSTADVSTGFTFETIAFGATAPVAAVSTIRTLVFNERLQLRFSGLGNLPIYYNPEMDEKYQLLPDSPDSSWAFEADGRIFCNDKTDRDQLHYSAPFDETQWLGIGDSGGLLIGPGDGDPEGLVNGYKYKGLKIISKKAKRYRVIGDSPELYVVELITDGLGNEGAMSVSVDESDVVFLSRRGIHSQQATDAYGDTDAAYLSAKIKPTFNDFNPSKLKYTQAAHIPELNTIAFSIAEGDELVQGNVWLYNTEVEVDGVKGAWYRWPDISCQALSRRFINDRYKLIFGTNDGRLIQAQDQGNYTDFDETGIQFRIRTGTIYPGNNPQSMKSFKKLSMIYRPKGNFSFTVRAYIDNHPAQAFSFNQISGIDLLGETFVLGNSILGSSAGLAPFTFTMDGIGRGIVFDIIQPSADEQVELWGFAIEFEDLDVVQETE